MNVREGVSVMAGVKVIVAISVIVGVRVMPGAIESASLCVAVPVGMAVGLEAIREDAAAPTDETSWATINTIAMSAAAMPREARDLLT